MDKNEIFGILDYVTINGQNHAVMEMAFDGRGCWYLTSKAV